MFLLHLHVLNRRSWAKNLSFKNKRKSKLEFKSFLPGFYFALTFFSDFLKIRKIFLISEPDEFKWNKQAAQMAEERKGRARGMGRWSRVCGSLSCARTASFQDTRLVQFHSSSIAQTWIKQIHIRVTRVQYITYRMVRPQRIFNQPLPLDPRHRRFLRTAHWIQITVSTRPGTISHNHHQKMPNKNIPEKNLVTKQ